MRTIRQQFDFQVSTNLCPSNTIPCLVCIRMCILSPIIHLYTYTHTYMSCSMVLQVYIQAHIYIYIYIHSWKWYSTHITALSGKFYDKHTLIKYIDNVKCTTLIKTMKTFSIIYTYNTASSNITQRKSCNMYRYVNHKSVCSFMGACVNQKAYSDDS